ncbi:AMP-binding protein [Streptomyces sp. NPDC097619]|uniref:AMP-binding protein n=1 Tax=Streptomyces sp. NPDC097619 TaxID=3157228 RepID=UPI00332B5537
MALPAPTGSRTAPGGARTAPARPRTGPQPAPAHPVPATPAARPGPGTDAHPATDTVPRPRTTPGGSRNRPQPQPTIPRPAQPPADGGVPLADLLAAVRPPRALAEEYRRDGAWRSTTVLHDLHRAAAAHPHRTAITAHRAHQPAGTRVTRLSYGQLVALVDRFAHALAALGIGPGDPIAFQLPNWWESCALLLACLRTGAVAVPVMPGYGSQDLEAVLTAAQPRLCVVPDLWEGASPAEALADLAPALPWLRHRIVLGDAEATGALDFTAHFVRTPHERYQRTGWLPLPPDLADRICLTVNSVGLRETHTMYMHTPNSLHARLALTGTPAVRPGEAVFSALPLAALPSLLYGVLGPLAGGGTAVLQDVWDPETALDLLTSTGAGLAFATPAQWSELLAAHGEHPREPLSLRRALSSDPAGTSTRLVQQVHETWRVPLTAGEDGTTPGQEPDRPGPASSPAVWQRGTGGLRLTWDTPPAGPRRPPTPTATAEDAGRRQEVGGVFLMPVTDIEERLLAHPRIAEAAVLGYVDPQHGELACAVLVPAGDPPALPEIREHLLAHGTAEAHLPARLELVGALPRADTGALDRRRLRALLTRRQALTGPTPD